MEKGERRRRRRRRRKRSERRRRRKEEGTEILKTTNITLTEKEFYWLLKEGGGFISGCFGIPLE